MKASKLFFMIMILVGIAQSEIAWDSLSPSEFWDSLIKNAVEPTVVDLTPIKALLDRYGRISNNNGILYFVSWDHVKAAQNYIEALARNWDGTIKGRYGNNIPDSVHLAIAEPYQKFEALYAFKSLRAVVAKAFLAWLNTQPRPDPALDPERDVVPEVSLQTVLNPFSEINVGGTFARVLPTGTTTYPSYLALVSSRTAVATSSSSVASRLLGPTPGCGTNKFKSKWANSLSGLTDVFCRVRHYLSFGIYVVRSDTRNYKKISGSWHPAIGLTYTRPYGHVSGLIWDPPSESVQANWCNNQEGYNWNPPFAHCFSMTSSLCSKTLTVNYKTQNLWTHSDHTGQVIGYSPYSCFDLNA